MGTTEAVLRVSGRNEPADDNIILQRALRLRNPYVDVLNLLQAELLQRKRTIAKLAPPGSAADDEALDDALLVTINGIAAGMQKSGSISYIPSRAFLQPLVPDAHRTY